MSQLATQPGAVRIGPRIRLRVARRGAWVCVVVAAATVILIVLSLSTGDYQVLLPDLLASLTGSGDTATDFVVLDLRLPRVLTAVGAGIALGVAGAIFQSITRNPLGSPDIIGFNWGASAGAVAMILLVGGSTVQVSVAAVLGGTVTALLVYLLAFQRGVQGYRLILVGIGLSAMMTAVVHYLVSRANLTEATEAQVWLIGTLNGRGWGQVIPLWITLAVLLPVLTGFGRRTDMLEMGDDTARALGIRVETTRLGLVVVAVLLAGVCTAVVGPVQFVALSAPQVARRMTRSTGAGVVAAGLTGGFLLLLSDFAAQRVFGDVELPVGVLTAAVGGMYLAWLLAREWRAGRS